EDDDETEIEDRYYQELRLGTEGLRVKLGSVAKAKEEYDHRISIMEAPADKEHPIVLSGKHTFDTQIAHVLPRLITK
ncbi:hypothetical protein IJG66_01580, partial [Candidatus Saccharibacteria bacterium]|nr:hypothetical protein [Candidatus Saccharibacteria bacterium]